MVAYTYSRVAALNFNTTPPSVAKSATGSVYAIADTTFTTPLNVTMVVGGVVTTSLSSDALGFFPDFTVDNRTSVVWKQNSSSFTTVLTTTDPVPGAKGDPGEPGIGVKGDRGDLATWQAATFYPLNQVIANPSGDLVKVIAAHTSGVTYDATKFDYANSIAVDDIAADKITDTGSATRGALDAEFSRKFQVNAADYATPQLAAAAVAPGGRLFFPPGTYALTAPIQITVDNVYVDAPGATFTQATWGQAVFDLLNVSGTVLDVGLCEFVGTRSGVGSPFRGSSAYVFGAAVWANRDRTNIRSLRSKNMAVGVHFASYDGTTAFDRIGVNNRIGRLEVEGANFGVLWSGQKALTIEDLYVHDDIDDSAGANPTHAYYCSAVSTLRASGLTIKKARAENILNGSAYQLKYTDGTSLTGHTATNCAGLVNILDCDDLTWDGMIGTGMLANSGGAISFGYSTAACKRPSLSNTSVVMATGVDTRAVSIWADDAQVTGLAVEANHSVAVNTGQWDIIFRGASGRVRGLTLRSAGAAHTKGVTLGSGADVATGWVIEDVKVTNARSVLDVTAGSTGAHLRYSPAQQVITGAGAPVTGVVSITAPTQIALSTFGSSAAVHALIAGTCGVPVASSAVQVKVTTARDITLTSLTWFSSTQSGNYDIGVVDDASDAVLWSKGATAWPAVGTVTETVPSVALKAGKTYRFVFASDATTGLMRGATAQASDMLKILNGSFVGTYATAAYPLPTTTLAPGSAGSTRTPLIIAGGT